MNLAARRHRVVSLSILVAQLTAVSTAGADWPQFRGLNRDGKSPETGLLQEWPEQGPPLAWRAEGLGEGYSSVAVVGRQIFTMGDLDDGQYVFALSESGELIWRSRVGERHVDSRGGSRSTPTVDGGLLYVVTTDGSAVALSVETGEEAWRRNLVEEFGATLMQAMGTYDWRFAESPLVDGDRVMVTPGSLTALMVALHRETGEEIWRTQGRRLGPLGSDGAAYSSAVVSEAGGRRHYVQLVGRGLIGVDAESGELLWNYNRIANDIANIATPIVSGNLVFATSGYGTGAALVEITSTDGGLEAREVYFLGASTLQNHHGGVILHEGILFTGTGHNNGFPVAVHLRTGEVAWGPVRNRGRDSAAVTYADGRLYFRYQDGRMILADASGEAYRERGSFMLPEVLKESWAPPVIADGKLLLKEQGLLYCYDIRAEESTRED